MLEIEDMLVYTRERAAQHLIAIRPETVAVGIVYLQDDDPLAISFRSLERVVEFIREMNPRRVRLESHINEDCTPYTQALSDYATHTKH